MKIYVTLNNVLLFYWETRKLLELFLFFAKYDGRNKNNKQITAVFVVYDLKSYQVAITVKILWSTRWSQKYLRDGVGEKNGDFFKKNIYVKFRIFKSAKKNK